jgi:hypothetical protein
MRKGLEYAQFFYKIGTGKQKMCHKIGKVDLYTRKMYQMQEWLPTPPPQS